MVAKKKPAEAPQGKMTDDETAQCVINPRFWAIHTIKQWSDQPELTDDALAKELHMQIERVLNGNMRHAEAMLLMQAQTLDSIFYSLACRAEEYIVYNMPTAESCLKLAIKAQGQCRMTLETLSNLKRPPVVFAAQANINNGNQQINNGVPAPATHTEENKNQPNELLTEIPNATLDTGRTIEAIGVNSKLEAVG